MNLTKQEIAALKHCQRCRDTAPTFVDELRRGRLWNWVIVAVYIAFLLVVIAFDPSAWYGWLMLGFMSGILYMRFKRLWCSLGLWRLTREITDWKRVDELIRENEKPVA